MALLMLSCAISAQGTANAEAAATPKKIVAKSLEQNKPDMAEGKASLSQADMDDTTRVFQATVEQSIEAARKQKIRDLAEIERERLGIKAPSAALIPIPTSLPTEKVALVVKSTSTPRLWSLTASGLRVWAEVWFDGRIIQLDSMDGQIMQFDSDERTPDLGDWTPLTLTSDGLLLGRKGKATAKKSKQVIAQERLLLRPPAKGGSVVTYKFPVSTPGGLPDSAQRASQLPIEQLGTPR